MVDKAELEILVLLLWCGSASYCGDTVVGKQKMINKIVVVLLIKKTTPLGHWRCRSRKSRERETILGRDEEELGYLRHFIQLNGVDQQEM